MADAEVKSVDYKNQPPLSEGKVPKEFVTCFLHFNYFIEQIRFCQDYDSLYPFVTHSCYQKSPSFFDRHQRRRQQPQVY